ncbi:HAMP domain-containing histidine kinase [Ruegeria litorea]|uniref:histidine kinase n=1 Tax=Falsiruegeria litorea TaxID=1280831 RepID=A0ABS5WL09_9RHOB|nr:HAMP domain-containing sensor histidine kinase [Falsiruegeria litorea]MBT3139688.1 HAMP domain-containing histidine kinase [Falsiruegeria litorea]
MLAFSSIIIDPQGNYQFHDGTIFSLPPELCDTFRIQRYLKLEKLGWSKSEFGYMTLVKVDSRGNRYIIPGLYLENSDRPTKKFYGYKPQLSKAQVEQYLDHHLERLVEARNASEGELTALVHDLRHLSSSIYHSALEAEDAARAKSWNDTRDLVRTIIASQTMLKVRIDYLDFSNSVDRFDDIEKIPVYSRVDKVIRCFRADARHKDVEITLTGRSYRLAEGPNILDIAPYTLIENAIKYAPNNSEITVNVEDTEEDTKVSVNSKGPAFGSGDETKIFEKGFRGSNATLIRANGTGLGLYVAREVVETFNGEMHAEQSETLEMIGGIPFASTTFHFRLPTAGEDMVRKQKYERLQRGRARRRGSKLN